MAVDRGGPSTGPADRARVAWRLSSTTLSAPLVEILYFEDCPNHQGARELVERVAADLGIEPEVRLVDVQTPADAQRLRFLGSPTIRVNGRDVEPDADERREFAHSCRVYRTVDGFAGQPNERWVREALAGTHAD